MAETVEPNATGSVAESAPPCDCINLTNDALLPRNEELDTLFLINRTTGKGRRAIRIPTLLIEKKRGQRPSSMIPNFCPICGAPYETTAAAPASEEGGAEA